MHEAAPTVTATSSDLRAVASELAGAIRAGATIAPEIRSRLIVLRAALFQRGIYDPVLARVDSITVPPVSADRLAAQLEEIASSLGD
ncbi:MAG TPA: hypothetical protein VFL80_05270 [Thermoanaerobaculia bacterium]|nr:hypothetical protein [Thermoanaerobaculia bacterium]